LVAAGEILEVALLIDELLKHRQPPLRADLIDANRIVAGKAA
jgi:hypothetical protein